jgi:hypothetical protein
MIKEKLVFILGAGASHPYGYPLGSRLRHLILSNGLLNPDQELRSILSELGYHDGVLEFRARFQKTRLPTIDEFLADASEVEIAIGKIAISWLILSREQPVYLDTGEFGGGHDHWYEKLWQQMRAGTDKNTFGALNNVSVVTFNYDRSLERFFFTAIQSTFQVDDATALELLHSAMKISHVYGVVGSPHQYGWDQPSASLVQEAAKNITAIQDGVDEHDAYLDDLRSMIRGADKVCFLGFGYHDVNLRRLEFPEIAARSKIFGYQHVDLQRIGFPEVAAKPKVFGTVFRLGRARAQRAEHLVGGFDGGPPENTWNCSQLLEHRHVLWTWPAELMK